MKSGQVLASAATLAASASAVAVHNQTTVFTTVVSTAFTTYCPEPTIIPMGNVTYTITKATTLTITNCPCTFTKTGIPPPHKTNKPVCPPGQTCVQPPPVVVPTCPPGDKCVQPPVVTCPPGEKCEKPPVATGKPEEPGKPGEPGQPGKPGEPGQPGKIGEPGQPGNPGQPGKPGEPGQPGGKGGQENKGGEGGGQIGQPGKPGGGLQPQGTNVPPSPSPQPTDQTVVTAGAYRAGTGVAALVVAGFAAMLI